MTTKVSERPSVRAAIALWDDGMNGRTAGSPELPTIETLSDIIARETGCDEGHVEPEVDWKKDYVLPLKILRAAGSHVTLVTQGHKHVSEARLVNPERVAFLEYIADVVNADAERADTDCPNCGYRTIARALDVALEGVGMKLVKRDGCPNATDAV